MTFPQRYINGANQMKNYLFEANGGLGLELKDVQKFVNAMSELSGENK